MTICKSFKKSQLQIVMSFSVNAFGNPLSANSRKWSNTQATADELFKYV